MLKTNSKLVKERIRQLIVETANLEGYDIDTTDWNWMQIADKVREIALDEKSGDWYCRNMSLQERFTDWISGLPSVFDCDWHYGASAITILGDILDETEAERNKYTEDDAERMLDYLIWREMEFAHRKVGM